MRFASFRQEGFANIWLVPAFGAPFSLVPLTGLFDRPPAALWIALAVFGLAWGFWIKYRARLGSPLLLWFFLQFVMVFCFAFTVGCLQMTIAMLVNPPRLAIVACVLFSISLIPPWLLGVVETWRTVAREGLDVDADWMKPILDVDRWALRESSTDLWDFKPYHLPLIILVMSLPVALPLLGISRNYLMLVMVPGMMYLMWRGARPAGRQQVYLFSLYLLERRTGRPLLAMHEEELTELRRGFWFSRWLCGPLPPRPEPLPEPQRRMTRGARRGRR